MNKLGIIGGSGLYNMEGLENSKWIKVNTPWGSPSDDILRAEFKGKEIFFLPRHGRGHTINPSNINFRANIDALKQLGVTDIISMSAVGSLKENLEPGTFVIVDQFIDRTFARFKTFFDKEIVAHVSMAKPTSPGLMNTCEKVLKKLNIPFQKGGTYLVMEGPQFSTYAESNLYRSWGLDVIGMTNMPEAKLAREAEIRYATVAMVTDFDCWHKGHEDVSVEQVITTLLSNAEQAKKVVAEVVLSFEEDIDAKDPANHCLDVAIITDKKLWTKETIQHLSTIAGRVLNK
jgi:5'-methylthioadenosine phosphorylase